jgi:hypothetical protein
MYLAGRYIGLTMVILGVMGLASGQFLVVWLAILGVGALLIVVTRTGAARFQADPNDPITPLHVLAVVTFYAAIPWGIINLRRKKKRSGWFLIIGPFVVLGLAVAFSVLLKFWFNYLFSAYI